MFQNDGGHESNNHAGIATVPVQIAVRYGVPLIFWGEHGWTDLGGMHSMSDMVEQLLAINKDQLLRGYDWDDIGDLEDLISEMSWSISKISPVIATFSNWAHAASLLVISTRGCE